MPRSAKPQRTDLNQAVKTAPNQPYGQAGQQQAAQQAIPLPNSAAEIASMAQAAQQPTGPGPAGPGPAGPAAGPPQVQPGPAPGSLGAFNRMTEIPEQPVTHGSPSGPGAGPEALGMNPNPGIAQTIAQVAQASGNADLQLLAARAQQQQVGPR